MESASLKSLDAPSAMPTSSLSILLYATAVQSFSASYSPVSPPDWIVYSYPISDIAFPDTFDLGIREDSFYVPHDYYGFEWFIGISIVLPNGTNSGTDETDSMCSGQSGGMGNTTDVSYIAQDVIGMYEFLLQSRCRILILNTLPSGILPS